MEKTGGAVLMKSKTSAKFTLWANRILAAAVAVLCFTMYDILVWYGHVRVIPWQICSVIMIAFYLCVPVVFCALWCIEKLLSNILQDRVFIPANVRFIRRIRWYCAAVSLICAPASFFYPPLLFMVLIMGFLALVVSVVKNLMAAAVELQEENDLTV
jgi:hypothetical protein